MNRFDIRKAFVKDIKRKYISTAQEIIDEVSEELDKKYAFDEKDYRVEVQNKNQKEVKPDGNVKRISTGLRAKAN